MIHTGCNSESLSHSVERMLLLLIEVLLSLYFLYFVVAVYFESSKAQYPPGIACHSELRKLHRLLMFFMVLGNTIGTRSEFILLNFLAKLFLEKSENDPELVTKNFTFEGVHVRVYQPQESSARSRKAVLFFHGGGLMIGDIELYDRLCRYISKEAGVVVVSVGYRLAPKHQHPAAFEDCLNATIHLLKNAQDYGVDPSSVIICGDSAGGHLTASVSQALVTRMDVPKPLAQVLIYPSVQFIDFNLPSYQQNQYVPPLFRERALFYILHYVAKGNLSVLKDFQNGSHIPLDLRKKFSKWFSSDNIPDEFKLRGYKPHVMSAFDKNVYEKLKHVLEPLCSPLVAEDSVFRRLPKTYILTCEFDVLCNDGILYKKRLEDNGVSVTWHHVKDGFHGIINFYDQWDCESGKRAVEGIISFIRDA
ncbi:arylacetamide deacetylase-like 4 [Pyxicephalus adspersus]|uniref:arylacetamide deacetylase-like 4 n=1 Tax=Pyxicephalus adspersus TaxID=30357 RepID=UPI003B5B82F8